jgi:hypothetical protein
MQAVHSSGNPMSHSTHVGFRAPVVACSTWPTTTVSGSEPSAFGARAAPLIDRQSRATGIGHSFAAAGNPLRGFDVSKFPRFSASFARGVGQSGFKKSRGDRPPERIAEAFVFDASGVGNKPEPVSTVRGANGASRYAVPPSVVPERGQVSENVSKSSTKERCDVFHEHVAGSKLANEAGVLTPEARALARKASALPCEADVLAGEAAADGVNASPQALGAECHRPHGGTSG